MSVKAGNLRCPYGLEICPVYTVYEAFTEGQVGNEGLLLRLSGTTINIDWIDLTRFGHAGDDYQGVLYS